MEQPNPPPTLEFDDETVNRIFCGNEALFESILTQLYQQIDDDMARVSDAIDRNHGSDLKDACHRFMGGLVYCGILNLTRALESLSHSAVIDPHNVNQLTYEHQQLKDQVALFKSWFEHHYVSKEGP